MEGTSLKNHTTPGGHHISGKPPVGSPTARARIPEALSHIPNNELGEAVANLAASTVNAASKGTIKENIAADPSAAFKSSTKILR